MEKLVGNGEGTYSGDRLVLSREYGKTPAGNDLRGKWVLRDRKGNWIDYDQYRHDIAAKYRLELVGDA